MQARRLPKRAVFATSAQFGLLLAVASVAWALMPGAAERALTVLIAAVLALGIAGQHGARSRESRLAPVAQGMAVGGTLGAVIAVVALEGFKAWGMLGALLALPAFFPAVVPGRWRHVVTARWSDLADSSVGRDTTS